MQHTATYVGSGVFDWEGMTVKKHKWPICLATGLQRLGERKDARLALAAAARSRTRASMNGGDATWHVTSAWRCSACGGGYHLSSGPAYGGDEAA